MVWQLAQESRSCPLNNWFNYSRRQLVLDPLTVTLSHTWHNMTSRLKTLNIENYWHCFLSWERSSPTPLFKHLRTYLHKKCVHVQDICMLVGVHHSHTHCLQVQISHVRHKVTAWLLLTWDSHSKTCLDKQQAAFVVIMYDVTCLSCDLKLSQSELLVLWLIFNNS